MQFLAIDTMFVAAPNLGAVADPYKKLGLPLTSAEQWTTQPIQSAHVTVGDKVKSTVYFLQPDAQGTCQPSDLPLMTAIQKRSGAFAIGLKVASLDASLEFLLKHGIDAVPQEVVDADGAILFTMAWLGLEEQAGANLVLIEHSPGAVPVKETKHAFPILRLDHLAAITHDDFQEKTDFWQNVLGIPQTGEVVAPNMIIRQFQVGDVTMELLGPTEKDDSLRQRPKGLISMMAWEVEDLEHSVALAQKAGLQPSAPRVGVLPRTKIAVIPGESLGGVTMQLLQYVS